MKNVHFYSCGTPEHALGHLRVCGPLQRAGVEVHWFRLNEPLVPEFIIESDLVIIQRDYPRDLAKYTQLLEYTYRFKKPVVFEMDDLLWELPQDHPDKISQHYSDALWPMLLAAIHADAVTAASSGLFNYLNVCNPKVYHLQNYLDDALWKMKEPNPKNHSSVRIGYIGGDSHKPDIEMILPVLLEILQLYPRLEMFFWGLQPPELLLSRPNVVWHPLDTQNYADFSDYMGQLDMDIFIAPLKPNLFNQCKSAVKYFECSTLGAAGVCSDIDPFNSVIDNGRTGFLASNQDDWMKYLCLLIENPEIRLSLARSAQAEIRKKWLLSDHYNEWVDAYQTIMDQYHPQDHSDRFRLAAKIQSQRKEANL